VIDTLESRCFFSALSSVDPLDWDKPVRPWSGPPAPPIFVPLANWYEYRVRAVNEAGYSDYSNVASPNMQVVGDANCDGRVDGSDYTVLDGNINRSDLVTPSSWLLGDVNQDGQVDGSDYVVLDGQSH
jgi:hypothetical protein